MSFEEPFELVPKEGNDKMGTPDAIRERVEESPEQKIITHFERLVEELQLHKGRVDEAHFQNAVDEYIAKHQEVIDNHLKSLPRKGVDTQNDELAA